MKVVLAVAMMAGPPACVCFSMDGLHDWERGEMGWRRWWCNAHVDGCSYVQCKLRRAAFCPRRFDVVRDKHEYCAWKSDAMEWRSTPSSCLHIYDAHSVQPTSLLSSRLQSCHAPNVMASHGGVDYTPMLHRNTRRDGRRQDWLILLSR